MKYMKFASYFPLLFCSIMTSIIFVYSKCHFDRVFSTTESSTTACSAVLVGDPS